MHVHVHVYSVVRLYVCEYVRLRNVLNATATATAAAAAAAVTYQTSTLFFFHSNSFMCIACCRECIKKLGNCLYACAGGLQSRGIARSCMYVCVHVTVCECAYVCFWNSIKSHDWFYSIFSYIFSWKRIKMPNLYLPHKQATKQRQQQQQTYWKMQCQCSNIDHDYDGTLQIQTVYARILSENFKNKKCQKKREVGLNWTELDLYENQLMMWKKNCTTNKAKQSEATEETLEWATTNNSSSNNGDDSNKSELQQITRAVITHAIIDARRQFPL